MRTTLTLEPDVVALLKQTLKDREAPLKQVINEALRRGLAALRAPQKPPKPFRVKPFKGTRLLVDVSCTSRALALVEGEDYK